MTTGTPLDRKRAVRLAAALVGLSAALGACTHTGDVATTASVPDDYKMRHPITVTEANHSIVVFVGRGRGGLSASQRTDVAGLAQGWVQEGNRPTTPDRPVRTPHARAAPDSLRGIHALRLPACLAPRGLSGPH